MAKQNNYFLQIKNFFMIAFLVTVVAATVLMANSLIKNRQNLSANAAAGNAQLFLEPSSLTLPSTGKVNVWSTVDKPVSFVRIEMTFDKNLVKLSQEIALTNPIFARDIQVTSMADANSTGRVVIALGVDPSAKEQAPTGSFAVASLFFQPLTTASVSTSLNFDATLSQLVDTGAVPFTVTGSAGTLTLNPVASPLPSAAPAGSADSTLPTVTFTSPVNGTTLVRNVNFTLKANATDNVSVAKVVFSINGSVKCTDTAAPYECKWKPSGKAGTNDTLTARAYDAAGNSASQTITVIKK